MFSAYNLYKKLKKKYVSATYRGVNVGYVLGSFLAEYSWNGRRSYYSLRLMFITFEIDIDDDPQGNLATYYIDRADYAELYRGYKFGFEPKKINSKLSIFSFLNRFKYIPKVLKISRQLSFFSPLSVFFLWFAVSLIEETFDKLQSLKIYNYVAFNSAFKFESVISLVFMSLGVKTYSLQHGMYLKYEEDPPLDIINYENNCSQFLLLWGEYTRDQIKDYIPSHCNLLCAGYPELKIKSRKRIPSLFVALPRSLYSKSSLKLLDILEKSGFQCIVRSHPNDKLTKQVIKKYKNLVHDNNPTLREALQSNIYLLVISFNSTALFEGILFEQKCAQFIDENEFLMPKVPCFCNVAELKAITSEVSSLVSKNYFFSEISDIGLVNE